MLPFVVHFEDGLPVYEQLIGAVHRAVVDGQLAHGDVFPSVRTLSKELHISPTTAHKVVSQLKAEGMLVSRPGIGMIVSSPTIPGVEERKGYISDSLQALVREAQAMSLDLDDVIDALCEHWPKTDKETDDDRDS